MILFAPSALAQGFAGLGSEAEGYLLPNPDTRFEFPRDHGPHPGFRVEWWYLTANLTGTDGRDYGLQWTLFRSALSPDDRPAPIWMGHAAVTTPDAHFATERFARGGTGQAGVTAAPFEAWIDEWQMTGIDRGQLRASGPDFAYELTFAADAPFVPQGAAGYSVKAETGQASHYYSQPFYDVSGVLQLPGGAVDVSGQAWLDREWSSQLLSADQSGWDWLSLHLDTGEKLMGFRLRSDLGSAYSTGTWIEPDGTPGPLAPGAFVAKPLRFHRVAGREIPVEWRVEVPEHAVDVTVTALNPDSWMDLSVAYWEGPVRVTGTHSGRGYLEMTGYE
nr:lipocalin-like domain-containing protein [Candidatus Rhodobacter lobularis]